MTELTWETAADWDAAQAESGVVHESVANTDHDDDTIVKKGYRAASPTPSSGLEYYHPLNEDSGSTAYDFSGNNRDGTYNGPSIGQTGILGTTAGGWDSNGDDEVTLPEIDFVDATFMAWAYSGSVSNGEVWRKRTQSDNYNFIGRVDDGDLKVEFYDGNGYNTTITPYPYDQWNFIAGTVDQTADEVTGYLNGSSIGTASIPGYSDSSADGFAIGNYPGSSSIGWDGRIAHFRAYSTVLSATQIQDIYDVVNTNGSLTTAKKTS